MRSASMPSFLLTRTVGQELHGSGRMRHHLVDLLAARPHPHLDDIAGQDARVRRRARRPVPPDCDSTRALPEPNAFCSELSAADVSKSRSTRSAVIVVTTAASVETRRACRVPSILAHLSLGGEEHYQPGRGVIDLPFFHLIAAPGVVAFHALDRSRAAGTRWRWRSRASGSPAAMSPRATSESRIDFLVDQLARLHMHRRALLLSRRAS